MPACPVGTEPAAALCRELSGGFVAPPEWLLLIPAGRFQGRDGRHWVNDTPGEVVRAFNGNGAHVPIDWEHSTELRAPKGEDAPAAGWITAVEERNGEIWGRAEWTARARNQIQGREYRYYSIAFDHTKPGLRVVRISSVGLTNKPNLYTRALDHKGDTPMASSQDRIPALNREQAAIAAAFGNTAEDLARQTDAEALAVRQGQDRALNHEQEAASASIAAAFGNTPEDLAKYAG